MRYEINVSKNGQHFFATHERSITCERQLVAVFAEIAAAFPKANGYEVSVTRWEEVGYSVDTVKLLTDAALNKE